MIDKWYILILLIYLKQFIGTLEEPVNNKRSLANYIFNNIKEKLYKESIFNEVVYINRMDSIN